VDRSGKSNPTNRKAKFVAPEEERSRQLRRLLAGLLRFFRKERPLPGTPGEISFWVCQLWGLSSMRHSGGGIEMDRSAAEIAQWLGSLGPDLSPAKIDELTARSRPIPNARFREMLQAAKNGDLAAFNAGYQEAVQRLIDLWLPGFVPPFPVSFDVMAQIIRALRATMICTALDRVHPLTLIGRAWEGDQQAVFSLVRADRLFLQDRCTQEVIRKAALENNQQFMNELAAAQKYQARLRRRDLLHIYFDFLFILEMFGQALPRIDELQRLLDPHGTIYKGDYAFERDLQRQRDRFTTMITEAHAELPHLLSLYSSASTDRE
jgi:hypothetical protein